MKYIDAEQIRAEIEKMKKHSHIMGDIAINSSMRRFYEGAEDSCNRILAFLDTHPEQPVGDTDGKAMLYVAEKSYKIGLRDGKASNEQSVEGLEEEIERVCAEIEEKNPQHRGLKPSGIAKIARHFAEWGAEHLKR